jgi:hypothetical protein
MGGVGQISHRGIAMPWRDFDSRPYLMRPEFEPERTAPMKANDICFMRRQHRCEKVFGASKSCFVACPTDDSLEPLLALLEAKLAAHGIEAVIAVKERAYGQDIVCTKICGRIIESRFCVAILDEVDRDGVSVANPNVYYEYGLMTALRKHVIPLQRDDLNLAFNIQSQDTVKYNPRNMADELERAIRDAIGQTEPGQGDAEVADAQLSARGIRRRLELAGYVPADRNVLANEASQDTQFITFLSDADGYLFLAKIDDDRDVANYLDDLPVLVYRLEELRRRTELELQNLPETIASVRQQLEESGKGPYRARAFDLERELDKLENRAPTLERRLESLAAAHVGFVSAPDLDPAPMREATLSALAGTKMSAAWNDGQTLSIGERVVQLTRGAVECGFAVDLEVS